MVNMFFFYNCLYCSSSVNIYIYMYICINFLSKFIYIVESYVGNFCYLGIFYKWRNFFTVINKSLGCSGKQDDNYDFDWRIKKNTAGVNLFSISYVFPLIALNFGLLRTNVLSLWKWTGQSFKAYTLTV